MKILPYRKACNFREATILAFEEAGRGSIPPDIANLFASVTDNDKLRDEAERSITGAIHGRYGRSARWHGKWWLVPLPQPGYDALPMPQITFSVQAYLAGAITVDTADDCYRATLVGPTGKPEKLILPASFLQAMLDDDLECFEIVGKDGKYTVWSIPGLREPLRLPDDFISGLSAVLRLKSVASWLLDFGSEGKAIAPMVVGSLLGLQFHSVTSPLPVGEQPFKQETVVQTLTRMFGSARAVEMFEQAAPHLKSSMSNEEAVSLILKEAGRR